MFAAAFIGLTMASLTLMARFGASVPEPLLLVGWRLFGLALLSVAGSALPSCSPEAASSLLGTMGMLTAGVKFTTLG